MNTLSQIVDCLAAAPQMPNRCGPYLSSKISDNANQNHFSSDIVQCQKHPHSDKHKTFKTKYRIKTSDVSTIELSFKIRL